MRDDIPWLGHLLLFSTATFVGALVLAICQDASVARARLEGQIAAARMAAVQKQGPMIVPVGPSLSASEALAAPGCQPGVPPRHPPVPGGGIVHSHPPEELDE